MSPALSRRKFLKTSGALIVSFSASSLLEPFAVAQGPFGTHLSHIYPNKLDSWLAVGADGMVTAYTGKCDFGQGIFTVQTQLVAEELRVALDRVRIIQCDTSVTPGGHNLRQPIHAGKLQHQRPRRCSRHRPRCAAANGFPPPAHPC